MWWTASQTFTCCDLMNHVLPCYIYGWLGIKYQESVSSFMKATHPMYVIIMRYFIYLKLGNVEIVKVYRTYFYCVIIIIIIMDISIACYLPLKARAQFTYRKMQNIYVHTTGKKKKKEETEHCWTSPATTTWTIIQSTKKKHKAMWPQDLRRVSDRVMPLQ